MVWFSFIYFITQKTPYAAESAHASVCRTEQNRSEHEAAAEFRKLEVLASATRDGQEIPSSRRGSRAQTTDGRKVPELSGFSILVPKKGGANVIDVRRLYKSLRYPCSCLSHRPADPHGLSALLGVSVNWCWREKTLGTVTFYCGHARTH